MQRCTCVVVIVVVAAHADRHGIYVGDGPLVVVVAILRGFGACCPALPLGQLWLGKHGEGLVAADASALYARNVLDFLKLIITKEGALNVDMNDDIVAACLMTQAGEVKRK